MRTTAGSQAPKSGFNRAIAQLRRWLLTGLILIAPAFVTFLALRWLFLRLDSTMRHAIAWLTGVDVPGAGVVMIVLLLVTTGAVASNLALRGAIRWAEGLLDRIPLVRTLYSGVKQLIAPLADEHGAAFQKVVMIEYPDRGIYSLGFLIKPEAGVSPDGELLSAVLVPTNHLHLGCVALVPQTRLHAVDMSAEEGLRFLVSMGSALDRRLVMTGRAALGASPADAPSSRETIAPPSTSA